MKVFPMHDYVLIEPVTVQDKDSSGMVLSMVAEKDKSAVSHGRVVAISKNILIDEIEVGDTVSVILGISNRDKVEYHDGIKMYLIPQTSIVAKIVE